MGRKAGSEVTQGCELVERDGKGIGERAGGEGRGKGGGRSERIEANVEDQKLRLV